MKKILEPIAEGSYNLQYRAVHGNTGSLWQWLDKLDGILTFLEGQKALLQAAGSQSATNKVVLQMVENMWAKLDYYFRISDESPAYRAAIILHPGKKLHWFRKHWHQRQEWVDEARDVFEQLVESYRPSIPIPKPPVATRSSPRKRKPRTDYKPVESDSDWEQGDAVEIEINRYLDSNPESRAVDEDGNKIPIDVIKWWFNRRVEYPILSRVALDLAAAPPESSDLERKFSDALNIFNNKRNHLKPATIEAIMLLKAGHQAGLTLWPKA